MAQSRHGTLVAGQVTTVEVENNGYGVQVINRNFDGVIWVRLDGEEPTVEGNDSFPVFGVRTFAVRRSVRAPASVVKLIADAAYPYTVEAV